MTRSTIYLFLLLTLVFDNVSAKTETYPGLIKLIIGRPQTFGILSMHFTNSTSYYKSDTIVFKFYQKPADKYVSRQLSFYFDYHQTPRKEIIIQKDYHSWLHPTRLVGDTTYGYFQFFFTCKSKNGNWFEIIVNEQTQETMWIEEGRFVRLLSWSKLDKKETVCVKPKTKIYTQPDSSSTAIKYPDSDFFTIEKTKGSWMKIKAQNSDPCGTSSDTVYYGWVNFKSKDKFLIDVFVW